MLTILLKKVLPAILAGENSIRNFWHPRDQGKNFKKDHLMNERLDLSGQQKLPKKI